MHFAPLRLLSSMGLAVTFAATAAAAPPELISINAAGNDTGNGASDQELLAADGRFVVFSSEASNFGPTDSNGLGDVYLRDRQTQTTVLISVNAAGTDSANAISAPLGISDDGRFVLFTTEASNVVTVPADTNGTGDLFLRDLQSGTTTLISVNAAGTGPGNSVSNDGVLSRDGRLVAFSSHATDFGYVDNNGGRDIFVRDWQAGTTELISVNGAGTQTSNGASTTPQFSADGNLVVYNSSGTDLGFNDTNNLIDVFVRNRSADTTELVSWNAAETDSGNNQADFGIISGNGRYVAFNSYATNHSITPDTNGQVDIYLRDLQAGVTTLLSANAAGTDSAAGISFAQVLSDDGRFVAFHSTADDVVSNDSNGGFDVFVKDQQLGTTSLVSVNAAGTTSAAGASYGSEISRDGRYVVFLSEAADVAAPDTNLNTDLFRRDLQAGVTVLLSSNSSGTNGGNGDSSLGNGRQLVSSDGRWTLFHSAATDIAAVDSNGENDLFVAEAPVTPASEPKLYLSPDVPVLAGGILVGGQDVVSFSPQTQQYQRFFEGADVGLLLSNVDALDILPDGDLLLSFSLLTSVAGVGLVENEDVVRFTPSSTGSQTAGSFSLFFNGDAHGITGLGKNLDAIAYEDGVLAFSTSGLVVVDGRFVQNEDVVALDVATNDTELLFDGSAFGFAVALANVDGFELLADGDLLLSFDTPVTLPGLGTVADEDVIRFHPSATNPARSGTFSAYFDGSQNDWTGLADDVDAIAVD
jgi:hypothetical protein